MNTNEIAEWIRPALAGVDLDDALTAAAMGSDDMPYLELTERTYSDAHRHAYGEWGCSREVVWDLGKRGTPLDADAVARRAAEYVTAFVARNGRVRLSLRGTVLNRVERREMIVEVQ